MTRWFYLSVALTLAALGATLYVWQFRYDDLPEQVPVHWDAHFDPDGFSPKQDVLKTFFLLPGAMALICVLTLVLPWLSPRHFEVTTFRSTYGYVMMLATALMGYLHVAFLWGAMQPAENKTIFMRFLLGGICLFFALMGNVMGKVRRNFWVGVRTPWTLASERVWNDTHRLAGRMFVAAALLGLVLLFLPLPTMVAFISAMALILASALYPAVYSAAHYKRLQKLGQI